MNAPLPATDPHPIVLQGVLGAFGSIELLQFVSQTLPVAQVTFVSPSGSEASILLARGGCLDARFGKLRGREAAVAALSHPMSKFFVREADLPSGIGAPATLTELVLEVARLEDELERRKDDLPEPARKLTLTGQLDASDPLDCGLPFVARALAGQPRSLEALEADLPLAPVRVRLSVALLREQGRLTLRASTIMPRVLPTEPAGPLDRELEKRRGALRVLVACPAGMVDCVEGAVRHFAEAVTAPAPAVSRVTSGPTFVRIRPARGGVISFTFLPTTRQNRVFFDSFVRSTDAVILGDDDEAVRWGATLPSDLPTAAVASDATDHCLYDALVRALT